MSGYISRSKLIKAVENLKDCYNGFSDTYDKACIIGLITEQQSVERKCGKWMKAMLDHEAFGVRPTAYYCSECHQIIAFRTFYCPNCGADMRGDSE